MDTLARVQKDIEAVVDANRRAGEEKLASKEQELARETKARREAEAVLAETTKALSYSRELQAKALAEQVELQATISQMRDELRSKDAELSRLLPDHRPSFWTDVKQVGDAGRPSYDGLRQQLHDKDAQLDEALAIIKELTDTVAGPGSNSNRGAAASSSGLCPSCGFDASAAPEKSPPSAEAQAAPEQRAAELNEEPEVDGPLPSAPMFWISTERKLDIGAVPARLGKLLGRS